MEFTPPQRKMLQTWSEERDSILREISIHTTELQEKKKLNADAGLQLSDLVKRIAEARGRIAEIDALEERVRASLPKDIVQLEARKSLLEIECIAKEAELNSKKQEHGIVISATAALTAANGVIEHQIEIVKSAFSDLIVAGAAGASDAKVAMDEIRKIAAEVIEKGNANVAQTNIILEKLPKYIFELQRPIPVRRHYARGTEILPEQKP